MAISTFTGSWDGNLTESKSIFQLQAAAPYEYEKIVRQIYPQGLLTLIAKRVIGPKGFTGKTQDKLKEIGLKSIPSSKKIGNFGYKWKLRGQVKRPNPIISTTTPVGGPNGEFDLVFQMGIYYPGYLVNVGNGLIAMVLSEPEGFGGGFRNQMRIHTQPGTQVFNFSTDIGTSLTSYQVDVAYGEGSKEGYSYAFGLDDYVNHLSYRRWSSDTTGHGQLIEGYGQRTIVFRDNAGKVMDTRWMPEKIYQTRLKGMLDQDWGYLHSTSTWRDQNNGTLLTTPWEKDPISRKPLSRGDGIITSQTGVNDFTGSSSDGWWNLQDLKDGMTALKKTGDIEIGNHYIGITGPAGYSHFTDIAQGYFVALNGFLTFSLSEAIKSSGGSTVGLFFTTIFFEGNWLTVCYYPDWSNNDKYSLIGSDGINVQDGMLLVINAGNDNIPNIEIAAAGTEYVDRQYNEFMLHGATGAKGMGPVIQSFDYDSWHCTSEDMITVYRTDQGAIFRKDPI